MRKDLIPKPLQQIRDTYIKRIAEKRALGRHRIRGITAIINSFFAYLTSKNITCLTKTTSSHIIQYQRHLYERRISTQQVSRHIKDIKNFFDVLLYNGIITTNPIHGVKLIDPPDLTINKITRYYSLQELKRKWETHLKKDAYCVYTTIKAKLLALDQFYEYLGSKSIKTIYKIDSREIGQYKEYLQTHQYKAINKPEGENVILTPLTQVHKLRSICQFFMYLARNRLIKENPSGYIKLKQHLLQLSGEKSALKKTTNTNLTPSIPEETNQLITKYETYLISSGRAKTTVKSYIRSIKKFWQYINEKNITSLKKVTKTTAIDYQTHTSNTISGITSKKYAPSTVLGAMIAIRSWFKFLVKYDYLTCDPTSILDLPKNTKGLGYNCMTERETKQILDKPDTDTPAGIRDKAILETLYSTGVRANELANIQTSHINIVGGLIRIEHPKGGKNYQRVIPIGNIACHWINQYLKKVRPYLEKKSTATDQRSAGVSVADKDYLFLTNAGTPIKRYRVSETVKKYVHKTGIRKNICAHSFRVSCATHMLTNNADIRYVQEQLGHKSIKTTQMYTRLTPKDLKKIHTKCHPREKHEALNSKFETNSKKKN